MAVQRIRAAVVQDAPRAFDAATSCAKAIERMEQAADSGAAIVVFPEVFLSGYPKGLDFGARVGWRTDEGREWFRRYSEGAIKIPGEETARLCEAAARCRQTVVIGITEQVGGTLYCTALYVGPEGKILGRHRKVMPTALERLIWGSGDGSTLAAVETPQGKLGAAICWENYMPLLRMSLYAQGVELYAAPTVDDRDSWIATMRHIALEGRCFVLAAAPFMRRGDFPADYPDGLDPDLQRVVIRGGSCILNPLGQFLVGPVYGEAKILLADLDRADLTRARLDFDAVGHYARPDLFQLRVNTAEVKPCNFGDYSADEPLDS